MLLLFIVKVVINLHNLRFSTLLRNTIKDQKDIQAWVIRESIIKDLFG